MIDALAPYRGDSASYLAEAGLVTAVNVAIALGRPLLVTGDPGTGKTRLAYSIAEELRLIGPLKFVVKTTSVGRDLLYRYDALAHYGAVLLEGKNTDGRRVSASEYIHFEALGAAIIISNPTNSADALIPEDLRGKGPDRALVLIDEIDKAPRDFPNDLLDEIETFTFRVTETGQIFSGLAEYRPILVITSNSEKNLPDAFLRRCVYYHVLPPAPSRLEQIVTLHLGTDSAFSEPRIKAIVDHFAAIREIALVKKPATAELLDWATLLRKLDIDPSVPGHAEIIAGTYSVLAKNKQDLELLKSRIGVV